MGRRSTAGLLAVALLLGLLVLASRFPVPYVRLWPGRTVDVLGTSGGQPIVEVQGRRTYPTRGELRMTTVSEDSPETRVSLVQALTAWAQPDVALMPYAAVYPSTSSAEQNRSEGAAQMVSAQDTAVAAALGRLGYRLPTYVEVTGVDPSGPSDDKLKPRDRILAVDGRPIRSTASLFRALAAAKPGDRVAVTVRRQDRERVERVTTRAAAEDPKRAQLGVFVGTGYRFPFEVTIGIDDRITGPSAGLMIALSVYDRLTPGALTGGRDVAGTGTISASGQVGPIGGVRQKIVGARDSGATLFLVPPANCEQATPAPVDGIRLVRAGTLASAIRSVRAYARDPAAPLPSCSGG